MMIIFLVVMTHENDVREGTGKNKSKRKGIPNAPASQKPKRNPDKRECAQKKDEISFYELHEPPVGVGCQGSGPTFCDTARAPWALL